MRTIDSFREASDITDKLIHIPPNPIQKKRKEKNFILKTLRYCSWALGDRENEKIANV